MSKELTPITNKTKTELQRLQLDVNQVTRTKSVFNQNQIQKLFNATPERYKYSRPGKGGGNWTYVRASYVRRTLDSLFGFNYDIVIETSVAEAFEVAKMSNAIIVKGYIVGRILDDKGNLTAEIRKGDFGRAEVKWQMEDSYDAEGRPIKRNGKTERTKKRDEFTGAPIPLDIGNDYKAAASDLLKRCAARFGIAADVYDPDEFQAIEIIGSDENNDRKMLLEKKIKNAKRTIKRSGTKVEVTK